MCVIFLGQIFVQERISSAIADKLLLQIASQTLTKEFVSESCNGRDILLNATGITKPFI